MENSLTDAIFFCEQETWSRQVQRSVRSHQHHQQRKVCGEDTQTSQKEENQEGNQNPRKSPRGHKRHHSSGEIPTRFLEQTVDICHLFICRFQGVSSSISEHVLCITDS